MTFDSQADLCGAVARLCVYPVTSCAGAEVQEADDALTERWTRGEGVGDL